MNGSFPTYTDVNTTPYVVNATDEYLSVDTTGESITIELPDNPTLYRTFVIKDRTGQAGEGNEIIIRSVSGLVDIDGVDLYLLEDDFESINLIWNGTSYEIY